MFAVLGGVCCVSWRPALRRNALWKHRKTEKCKKREEERSLDQSQSSKRTQSFRLWSNDDDDDADDDDDDEPLSVRHGPVRLALRLLVGGV